ncbi:MAG: FAD binding domain-containing protein [Acidobacteria bacterium]|nr:FAD binding domain-containing protein [Acidobacteriota bacterium]
MIEFILNNQSVETDLPGGTTVLDFVRYHKNLKGTKIGCREGDCGACTILVGELKDGDLRYRSMTSCLMPLLNARGKHIVTVEGINPADGSLTPAQAALVDESGTQCGFCTVGFVMSLTGFCLGDGQKTKESVVAAIDGNICRCTGYKSIERACERISDLGFGISDFGNAMLNKSQSQIEKAIAAGAVPKYFESIGRRLELLVREHPDSEGLKSVSSEITTPRFVAGGTDLYVQKHDEMVHAGATSLFDDPALRFIRETDETVEIGPSVVVTDLLESEVFHRLFPNLDKYLKLVSSTPIRNMATLAGNFVNASPIGDMTVFFLALDAELELRDFGIGNSDFGIRNIALSDLYLGYKQLAKVESEIISKISIRKDFTHFNFEKVSKRTYLDIASVNTAIALRLSGDVVETARVSIGGVAPTPLLLRKTSAFLSGKPINDAILEEAEAILQTEIAPISDVRGSAEYKRLLARQLFRAHFVAVSGER